MSDWQLIESVLQKASRRQRWLRAWRGFWYGLFFGAISWLLVHALFKVVPIPLDVLLYTGLASLACPLVGFIAGGWRRTSPQEIARYIDIQNKLQERLSTAYELSAHPSQESWKTLLISDAAKYLRKFDFRQILPHNLPKISRWAAAVLAVCVGLGFVPEYRTKEHLETQKEKALVQEVGKRLAELTRRNLENNQKLLEPTEKTMEAVKELGEQLEKAKLTRSEAMKEIASAADKIAEQLKEQEKQNPLLKNLQKANKDSAASQDGSGSSSKNSLEKMKADSAADALDQMKKDLEQMKKDVANLPSKDSAAGEAARDKMSQTLSNMAQQAKDLGGALPSLDEAIQALESNNTDQFVKDMEVATLDLEKMKESAQAMQSLQQQATQMAKDLASQLEKSQVEAAKETLEKMIDTLKKSNLSDAEKKALMAEVEKAINPAGEYGEVAKHLKDAVNQMGKNQNSQASDSLAKAAQELEKMMEEMANSDSLNATLAALAKAEQALATKRNWGECSKCGGKCSGEGQCNGKGSGPGQRFGAGVGQWGDDNLWVDQVDQEEVDNSQIQRDDTDSRGHTDRDSTQVDERFQPDKVPGKISPGGKMPSVTIKGVSTKGNARVNFDETVTSAAQSEAQSALNQDKVPRAYQNAVKGYFDDLKK